MIFKVPSKLSRSIILWFLCFYICIRVGICMCLSSLPLSPLTCLCAHICGDITYTTYTGLHPLPAGLDLAGISDSQQPTCLIIPPAPSRSDPPTDASETPGTNVLGTLSCQHRLVASVPQPVSAHLGLLAAPEPQVLPSLAFLCFPSCEIWGLSAHVGGTPVDSQLGFVL